jgi:hypothetical protein
MPNISFSYLYRDSSNYKNDKTIIFANPDDIPLLQIKEAITVTLIDGEYFYHDAFGLPSLFFNGECLEKDPSWHEFLEVSNAIERPTESISITEFLQRINAVSISPKS